jgi:hypothetical protein
MLSGMGAGWLQPINRKIEIQIRNDNNSNIYDNSNINITIKITTNSNIQQSDNQSCNGVILFVHRLLKVKYFFMKI